MIGKEDCDKKDIVQGVGQVANERLNSMVGMVSQDRNAVMLIEKQERRRWKKYCESLDVVS
jgi:hypothetical protein